MIDQKKKADVEDGVEKVEKKAKQATKVVRDEPADLQASAQQLYDQVGTLETWMKQGKLDNVTPRWRDMSEADVESFLSASLVR